MRLLSTEFKTPIVDLKTTGQLTTEWQRKLVSAGVLDMQGAVRGLAELKDFLFGLTKARGVLCDVNGNGDIQLRVNCDSGGNILDQTKSAWALRIGPVFDDFAIFRAPAGKTASFSMFLEVKSNGILHAALPPVYANNAAAAAGGLVAGDLYRTGGDPDTVCVVH